MCLYPQLIKNKKYEKNKKNGGVIPAILDKRVLAVPVPCGRCMECRKQEARKWQVRLLEDIKDNKNGKFVCLTFSNESIKELSEEINKKHNRIKENGAKEVKRIYENEKIQGYERDNEIATLAVRRFTERWRKKYKKTIRHWLITELGHEGTENIHMHGFIWSDEPIGEIRRHWMYGGIWAGYNDQSNVGEAAVNYNIKYVHKQDNDHKEYKPKILCSKGIGAGYIKRANKKNDYYKTRTGHKIATPSYYRNKIYTDEEREDLWLKRLDKEERWINGERVDIKKGEEEYYKCLEWHRKINERLGYGSNKKDWNKKKYEEQRRNLLLQKRIEDAEKKEGIYGVSNGETEERWQIQWGGVDTSGG